LKQAERGAGTRTDGLTTAERDELAQVRRENRRLREDVEILKRATAFLAERPAQRRRSMDAGPGFAPGMRLTCDPHTRLRPGQPR